MKITAHTLVKNEERYLWFSVNSVIDHVDEVLLWDTGSTDNTAQIIKELEKKYPKKIKTKFLDHVDKYEFTETRQKMLEETNSDWFMILDGDEVWWEKSIENHVDFLKKNNNKYEMLTTRYINIVGDIYHHQEEKAGQYEIDNQRGHLNIRFMNRDIPGIHFDKPHGQQGLFDENGVLIQERKGKDIKHFPVSYLHFTNMIRSSNLDLDKKTLKRDFKYKHELGKEFDLDFYYPEVFFKDRPNIVKSVWTNMSKKFYVRSAIESPLKKIKRKLITPKSGY